MKPPRIASGPATPVARPALVCAQRRCCVCRGPGAARWAAGVIF
ncbi:hypothetical protein [Verminephrobacter eiseniae]|nr:hypothetical protein [Verminephrobacter eiseniae]